MPATTEIRKKTNAHFRIVTNGPPAGGASLTVLLIQLRPLAESSCASVALPASWY
jgi:hypothetical protein